MSKGYKSQLFHGIHDRDERQYTAFMITTPADG